MSAFIDSDYFICFFFDVFCICEIYFEIIKKTHTHARTRKIWIYFVCFGKVKNWWIRNLYCLSASRELIFKFLYKSLRSYWEQFRSIFMPNIYNNVRRWFVCCIIVCTITWIFFDFAKSFHFDTSRFVREKIHEFKWEFSNISKRGSRVKVPPKHKYVSVTYT